MKKLFVLSIIILIVMGGCAIMGKKSGQTLIGTWKGKTPDGSEIVMSFKDDMTMESSLKGTIEVETTGKYTVDYTAVPITLDIFGLKDNQKLMAGVSRYLAIIRFIDSNKIQMCGSPEWEGRPTNFDNNIIEMVKEYILDHQVQKKATK